MKDRLDVLYAAGNEYAPFLGVSMLSLFENNRNMESIRVYAVLDGVSRENKDRLQEVAVRYGRELIIADAAELNGRMEKLGLLKYRGNYATNYRLFFDAVTAPDTKRLLYLDCDTIVCSSLHDLSFIDLDGACAAAVRDSIGGNYSRLIGFGPGDAYFNAGVLLIDTGAWRDNGITEAVLNHVRTVRSAYCNRDQDLLNIILQGKIKVLGPEYNFQPVHRAYSDAAYQKVYGFENYYAPEQISAARENPVILHTYRFLGQFPWHRYSLHPDTDLFDSYLARSPWKDYQKQESKCSSLPFRAERLLYCLLPETAFLRLFAFLQDRSFCRQEAELVRGRSS